MTKIASFSDLYFGPHPNHGGGIRALMMFPNGYGVSVIKSRYSYGGDRGLYEIAVMAGTDDDHELSYDTPITDDVLGYQTVDNISSVMAQVAALPKATA